MNSGTGFRDSGSGQRARLTRTPKSTIRNAFTLVELLVTISIIAILSAMLLGASSLAMQAARQARAEAMISRLDSVFSEHYDSFRHRRVELNESDTNGNGIPYYAEGMGLSAMPSGAAGGRVLMSGRLLATREQLRLELPDRWSDITLEAVDGSRYDTPIAPRYLEGRPSASLMYLRRYNQLVDNGVSVQDLLTNQSAECLYMIVMLSAGDGESASMFKESEVGDTDGDGAPEFLDAWGNPIAFLRWAPGFESDVQLSIPKLEQDPPGEGGANSAEFQMIVISRDRDPFDLFRVDRFDPDDNTASDMPRGFRLVPLIYSAGPDGEFGIEDGASFSEQDVETRNDLFTADQDKQFEFVADPYLRFNDLYLGDLVDYSVAADNVHNHNIEGR